MGWLPVLIALTLAAVPALSSGCSTSTARVGLDDGGSGGTGAGGAAGAATDARVFVDDASGCTAVIESHPDEGAGHIPCDGPSSYGTVPPSSGNHFPKWPDFKIYDQPLPWGNLVHSMEHGGVVIVYNCPDGCADELARAQAFIAALPADSLCTAPDVRRVILAPDPTLPQGVRWAAAAWTWTLRASCFDETAFASFVSDHYGHGLEPICAELHLPLCP